VTDLAGARLADASRYARFFHALLRRGVYLPPAQLECAFVSSAHSEEDVDRTLEAAAAAFAELAASSG
jgi:glutamate-1-semialdehyde 2,1-aminomutase